MLKTKGDGNGGMIIHVDKKFAVISSTIISLMIFLLGVVASTSISYGALTEQVNNLQTHYNVAGDRHTQIITDINTDIEEVEEKIHSNQREIDIICTKMDTVILTLEKIEKKLD